MQAFAGLCTVRISYGLSSCWIPCSYMNDSSTKWVRVGSMRTTCVILWQLCSFSRTVITPRGASPQPGSCCLFALYFRLSLAINFFHYPIPFTKTLPMDSSVGRECRLSAFECRGDLCHYVSISWETIWQAAVSEKSNSGHLVPLSWPHFCSPLCATVCTGTWHPSKRSKPSPFTQVKGFPGCGKDITDSTFGC